MDINSWIKLELDGAKPNLELCRILFQQDIILFERRTSNNRNDLAPSWSRAHQSNQNMRAVATLDTKGFADCQHRRRFVPVKGWCKAISTRFQSLAFGKCRENFGSGPGLLGRDAFKLIDLFINKSGFLLCFDVSMTLWNGRDLPGPLFGMPAVTVITPFVTVITPIVTVSFMVEICF
jgi:hypothetical protein